jgi:hypothetical protein
VKNYFANILKTKKIEVIATIEIVDNKVTHVDAKSPEIEKINKQLIENVKFDFLKQINKGKSAIEIENTLLTMEGLFDELAGKPFKSNVFYNNDDEFLEDLIKISSTKHYNNLRFLSSKHVYHLVKLQYVLKPFSFVFLIEGYKNFYIIWETLDTEEATYIWQIDKSNSALEMASKEIIEKIKTIKVQGKKAYIKKIEDSFTRIFHDYSQIDEGFAKWKGELERLLT